MLPPNLPSFSPSLGVRPASHLSLPPLAPSPFSLSDVPPDKFLACLILPWHLLLRRPRLTQSPTMLRSSAGPPLPALCCGHSFSFKATGLEILGQFSVLDFIFDAASSPWALVVG